MAVIMIAAWLVPLCLVLAAFVRDVRSAGRVPAILLALTLLSGLCLRLAVATPSFLFSLPDAHLFLNRVMQPNLNWHTYQGTGSFLLLSAAAHAMGDPAGAVFAVNALAGTLLGALLYLFVTRLTGRISAGLFAAFLLAFHVPSIRVDTSEQLAPLTMVAALVAWLELLELRDTPSWPRVAVAAIASAAALQFRFDAVVYVGFAFVMACATIPSGQARRVMPALLATIGLTALLALPRILVYSTMPAGKLSDLRYDAGVFLDILVSDRNVFVSLARVLPIHPLLVIAGLVALARRRSWRLLALFIGVTAFAWGFYFNEWTLDLNDALRFQYHTLPVLIAVAAIGADALSSWRPNRGYRAAVSVAIGAAAIGAAAPGWSLLITPTDVDREIAFLDRHVDAVPDNCRLLMLGPAKRPDRGLFGPGILPDWLLRGRTGPEVRFFPGDIDATRGEPCRVAFKGLDCYLRYPDVTLPEEDLARFREAEVRPSVIEFLDTWRSTQAGIPAEREECRALSDRFVLEPIATEIVPPGRPTWAWRPPGDLEIGFYRLLERR
jgi:hypothetical protein